MTRLSRLSWYTSQTRGGVHGHAAEGWAGIKFIAVQMDAARRRFRHALWLDPFNSKVLNGPGAFAWFDHDQDSAKHYAQER